MRLFPDPPRASRKRIVAISQAPSPEAGGAAWTLTRRQVLRWGLAGGTLVVLPAALVGCDEDEEHLFSAPTPTPTPTPLPTPTPISSFLTPGEGAALRAVVGRIVPTDALPGATDCGADEYINRLLSIVPDENDQIAEVYAGGPFSGRNPFVDLSSGTASTNFPTNDFVHFIPLTRLQRLSWRVQVLGSAAVEGANYNTHLLGPVVGLRDQYRTGLAGLQASSQTMHQVDFDTLSAADQDDILRATDPVFVELVTQHTLEGMFSVPEYGGNTDRRGWELIGYDGDSQPLGYSLFDETAMEYHERQDKPTSTPNPDEDFQDVDAATQQFLKLLVRVVGGPHFP